jgi:hypothetical protein
VSGSSALDGDSGHPKHKKLTSQPMRPRGAMTGCWRKNHA